MTKKELLNYLETIDSELTDAYNTGHDDPINSDSLYYIDSAKDLMGELIHRIENDVEISEKEEHDFNEAMNGEFKA
tara:strand:- start:201 stop:428 length:228 start_codon:yes stop_codon:yes gene_type:complete